MALFNAIDPSSKTIKPVFNNYVFLLSQSDRVMISY